MFCNLGFDPIFNSLLLLLLEQASSPCLFPHVGKQSGKQVHLTEQRLGVGEAATVSCSVSFVPASAGKFS